MADLANLTEAEVRGRCSEASFERGRAYYTGGAVKKCLRPGETSIEAQVSGTQTYRVQVWVKAPGHLGASCTCPYDYGGDCKHIVATLLTWLNQPERFRPPVDLKAVLSRRSKAELVDLLLDIISIYPDVVDDLAIVEGTKPNQLEKKVADLFEQMQPWGHLTEGEGEAHLRLLARQAERLAERGQVKQARRIYYALTLGCVDLCRRFGTYDFFSADVPSDFAAAYNDLAVQQLKRHGPAIKAEVEELYRDLHNPEALGLEEALAELWSELSEQGLIDEEASD